MTTEVLIAIEVIEMEDFERQLAFQRTPFFNDAVGSTCPKCGMGRTIEGHDPCIAGLPGVRFACCGHGMKRGYIVFENGIGIRFDAVQIEKYPIP